jgi:hypothetical protein
VLPGRGVLPWRSLLCRRQLDGGEVAPDPPAGTTVPAGGLVSFEQNSGESRFREWLMCLAWAAESWGWIESVASIN